MLELIKRYKKRKKQDAGKERIERGQAVIAEKILSAIIKRQRRLADFLNKRTAHWQPKRMTWLLLVFCFLSGTICAVIAGKSIRAPISDHVLLRSHMNIPTYNRQIGGSPLTWGQPISGSEYKRMQAFQSYMDSLGCSESGKYIRDSILGQRPKLMDSVSLAEQLYNQQQ